MTASHTNFSGEMYALHPSSARIPAERSPDAFDVRIVTSSGLTIPVHSSVLASASTVFQNILDQPSKHHNKTIKILGVSNEAVVAFVGFLYSSRCSEEEMDKYGIHLLTLSHVYLIRELKQRCTRGLPARLTVETVIDILQLARLCDAPDLYVECMEVVSNDFKSVEKTEGWKFLQENDPWLELEILGFIDNDDERKEEMRKEKEQSLYLQLSEAMDCLEHICTDGCTSVGSYDKELSENKGPCRYLSTCQGLQLLIRHFATCTNKYLEEPIFPRKADFDILNWWKVNSPKYPILSVMARDILGISMSIADSSASVFDAGGRVLDQQQSSLAPDVLQTLICTYDWLQMEFESEMDVNLPASPLCITAS